MKHRIIQNTVMIPLIFTLFESTLLHCQETVISTDLAEKMSSAPDSELIRVLVFFKAKKDFSPDERSSMSRMTLSGRQFYHATALKQFGDAQSATVKARISEGAKSGKAKLIADLWAAYAISCWAQKDVIEQLGNLPEVREIVWDFDRPSAALSIGPGDASHRAGNAPTMNSELLLRPPPPIEWGVAKIGAPQVWDLGYRGAGVIVALLDDGCDYTHPDLAGHLWDGASFLYNGQPVIYHGWDVYDGDNNPNGGSHGTKTAGIIMGDGTGGTQTGVAPDAKLMIISSQREGSSNETPLIGGIQWLFDMKIQNPSTFQYPDIINMSGGMRFDFKPSYQQWRILCKSVFDAGMIIIAAAGNEGGGSPGACSFFDPHIGLICSPCAVDVCPVTGKPCGYPIPYAIRTPANVPSPWLHPSQPTPLVTSAPDNHISSVIACGATDNVDAIAGSSSRGPAAWEDTWNNLLHGDGTGFACQYTISSPYWDYTYHTAIPNNPLIKPDVAAPSGVMSTASGGGYLYSDGTSAAAPHVSGTVALMLSANPSLKGDLPNIARILQETAVHLGTSGKNNVYGAGRVDAYHAVFNALSITVSSSVNSHWNLVSVPVVKWEFAKAGVYPTANSNAYTYEGFYLSKSTLENGTGYWLKFPSVQNITHTGLGLYSVTKTVGKRWNMIGSLSQSLLVAKIPTDIISSKFYGYNGSVFSAATSIEPGKAYWVRCSAAGTITLDQNSTADNPPSSSPDLPPSPDPPVSLSPVDGATNVSLTPTLSWSEAVSAETYSADIYLNGVWRACPVHS